MIVSSIRRAATASRTAVDVFPKFKLRNYQEEAIQKVHQAISRGVKRPAVVLATGGGKTVVFAHLIDQLKPSSPARGNKTLVLAHKAELIYQAAKSIREINPHLNVQVDMAHEKPDGEADVIIGSVPTLVRRQRLERYKPEEFKTIVLDECHHATAKSWTKILEYFGAGDKDLEIYVLGFTATMERSDGKSLGMAFDEIVFERGLLEMVENKELADATFSCIKVDVDLNSVAQAGGDYKTDSLSSVINTKETNLLLAVSYLKLREKYHFESTLIFCVDVDHCKTLCGIFQRQGINAQYVTGETAKPERAAIIEDFKNGKILVLCNVLVFTEGTDIPNIDSLFLARPTKSRPLLVQMIGRGLRLHKGKTKCHVVDIASTRGTGVQSVPTLFDLPADFTVEGKDFKKLKEEGLEHIQELNEKELVRRQEEEQLHMQLTDLKEKMENFDFETYEGFLELESESNEELVSTRQIEKVLRKLPLDWIRLTYDEWGAQISTERFFLLRWDKNRTNFSLEIWEFTSAAHRHAANYRVGNKRCVNVLEVNKSLVEVVTRAGAMMPTMTSTMNYLRKSRPMVTTKQVQYITNKIYPKSKLNYGESDDLAETLLQKVATLENTRAINLIFAMRYSTSSLWVKWELQRLLGPDKKSKKKLDAIHRKLKEVNKSRALASST